MAGLKLRFRKLAQGQKGLIARRWFHLTSRNIYVFLVVTITLS